MNLPNKLTVLRILLVPIFLVLLTVPFDHHLIVALVVFIIASLTDMIDGNLARKHNLITNLGKFVDPLADKMLTIIEISEGEAKAEAERALKVGLAAFAGREVAIYEDK